MRWWWRKPADNFEWREYVRTTILVRRNERRQKVEDAKQAAFEGAKHAGKKGVDAGAAGIDAVGRAGKAAAGAIGRGGAAAGSAAGRGGAAAASAFGRGVAAAGRGVAAAGRASRDGLMAGGAAAGRLSASGWNRLSAAAGPRAGKTRDAIIDRLEPAILALLRPSIALPLTVIAVVASAGTLYRWATLGFDTDVAIAGTIAVIAVVLSLLPRLAVGDVPKPFALIGRMLRSGAQAAGQLPGVNRLSPGAAAGALLALLALVAGGWWMLGSGDVGPERQETAQDRSSDADGDTGIPSVAVTRLQDLKGRGAALTGDLIKISGTTVKLSGIEAPERDQRCNGPNNSSWRCGQASRDALSRAIRVQPLICKQGATDEGGYRLATCTAGGKDVAEQMVRGGHVFASTGFFATYGSAESDARSQRAGLWQDEHVQRPSEYRARRWEEAKQTAPEGCPIKGSISRGSRTYVLPWSSTYEKVRVRESRGERWFCSEQEARAAGWRPTSL